MGHNWLKLNSFHVVNCSTKFYIMKKKLPYCSRVLLLKAINCISPMSGLFLRLDVLGLKIYVWLMYMTLKLYDCTANLILEVGGRI